MASPFALKMSCVVVIMCMVMGAPLSQAAITCGDVNGSMAPCIQYLRGKGGPVPSQCCNGVKSLNAKANTTPDRQAACRCLKTASGSIPGINFSLAGSLPSKCGVNIPYKISPSTNCDSVK